VRLIDLPGKVVRVIRMVELHINDTNRFRAAAHAIGWTPADEGDLPEDDPLDLAGAAMTFADRPLNLPGADDLGSECMAEVVERYDDDVAAWALPGRIDIKFQTGWLRKHADPPASHDPEPDFATLYPIDPDTPSWQLTPRTASELYKTIRQHASHATEDLSVHGNEPVTENGKWWLLFNRLPKATWNQTFEWRRLIARAPTDLLGQLERGEWPRPVCPAEAIMLRLALGELQDDDDFNDDSVDLPRHRDDYNFDACAENLLGDNAVTRLKLRWDDTHGRISHAACRPTQWLQTFTGAAPRDPYRGLRPLDHDLRHRPRSPAPETKPARTRPWSFLGRTLTTRP
jgi:hypothetical protein